MALNPIAGFLDSSYELASTQASLQRLLNMFPEAMEVGEETITGYLRGTPGLSTPLINLPSSPLRALAECGSPLSGASRLFAVSGDTLYEVFSGTVTSSGTTVTLVSGSPFNSFLVLNTININGSPYAVTAVSGATLTVAPTPPTFSAPVPYTAYASHGAVGNDGLPAQIFPNGNQIGVVSAGQFWCDNGAGIVAPTFMGTTYTDLTLGWGGVGYVGNYDLADQFNGVVSTGSSSPTVTWISGSQFTAAFVGQQLTILGATYIVAASPAPTSTSLTLTTNAAGPYASVPYSMQSLTTGDAAFNQAMAGAAIDVTVASGSSALTIAGIFSPTALYFTTNSGITPQYGTYSVPSSTAIVASASQPFTQADVGSTVTITAGPGWTGGTYTVFSVDTYGNATLYKSGAPANLGTPGSIGGIATQVFGNILARTGAYLDTFYIVNPPGSPQVYISASLNGLSWDPADFLTKESYPDNVGSVSADHQQLLVLGESHSEVWAAPGANPIFPFQPVESYAMNLGTAAPWSVCSMRDGPVWIGSSNRGQPVAYIAVGFQPQRISTHAIEQVWAKFPPYPNSTQKAVDASAFIFELDGHEFWQITFPTADQTWVYDRTASLQLGKSVWFERNSYDPTGGGQFHRHRASCHAFVFGDHYVGDFGTTGNYGAGNIYRMSDQIYQDNGQTITCQRVLPHLCSNRLRQFFSKFQLDMETAMDGVPLTVLLEWSDDGGVTFAGGGSSYTWTTSSTLTLERVVFWAMGSATDRVFRITVYGNSRITLLDAYLDAIVGYG